jgi:hypothetical protein
MARAYACASAQFKCPPTRVHRMFTRRHRSSPGSRLLARGQRAMVRMQRVGVVITD